MRSKLLGVLGLSAAVTLLFVLSSSAWPQGSGSSRTTPPAKPRPKTPADFHREFWQFLTRGKNPYKKWTAWPESAEPRAGEAPHGAFVKTYANAIAIKDTAALAHGSILVQEELDEDQKTLKSVSVMYRVKGTDPDHFDWYWLRYLPDGTVAKQPGKQPANQGGKPIAGKVASCIECHAKAGGDDLVHSNDEAAPEEGN
ncbi:MAG TPA: cytochrome P460 family protein [Pirellulales bacterium]|nr:cytochrome P460 family protein [Pirellulales bacterium]